MIILLYLLMSFFALAQQFQYELEGSFPTAASPNPGSPTTVNYTIHWNETSSEIQGIYQDNYFSSATPRMISGTKSVDGRVFNLILPQVQSGVQQLTFEMDQGGSLSGTVSLKTTTRTPLGSVLDDHSGFALMTTNNPPTAGVNDANNCTVGFGMLTGFCGLYDGSFNEIYDSGNRCNLAGRSPRFELSPDTTFRIILDYAAGMPDLPVHIIGSFAPSPTSGSVNISVEQCSVMEGTSFTPGNCKRKTLNGTFLQSTNAFFTGSYQIMDVVTGESCSYSLYLNRVITY